MAQRGVTLSDKEWYAAICDHGCIVCQNEFQIFTPCSPHHIEGRTKEGCHKKTIGLCGVHHQTGGEGVAFHATGKKTWYKKYGSERKLLTQTQRIINF